MVRRVFHVSPAKDSVKKVLHSVIHLHIKLVSVLNEAKSSANGALMQIKLIWRLVINTRVASLTAARISFHQLVSYITPIIMSCVQNVRKYHNARRVALIVGCVQNEISIHKAVCTALYRRENKTPTLQALKRMHCLNSLVPLSNNVKQYF